MSYIIQKTTEDGYSYYGYEGWSRPTWGPLDLSDVVRFTSGEALLLLYNKQLKDNEQLQYYGCYPKLRRG